MKIVTSNVNLTAGHTSLQTEVEARSFSFWQDGNKSQPTADRVSFSPQSLLLSLQTPSSKETYPSTVSLEEAGTEENAELRTLRLTLELLTGHRIQVGGFQPDTAQDAAVNFSPVDTGEAGTIEVPVERLGWGMSFDYSQSYSEEESLEFSAEAQIATADGRQIDLSFDLQMRRSFYSETSIHLRAGDARLVDPLVINFDGRGVEVGEMRMNFDLDGDATEEEMAFVSPGSGFLVLDRNNDGKVNDGMELFGPAQGNGFLELARFDSDADGWLDENDPVFAKLKIWMTDQAGNAQLVSATSAGIGALLLSPVDTPFKLADDTNMQLGQLRQTSLALLENGGVAALQEIDLVV